MAPATEIDNLDLKWMSGNIDIVIYEGQDIIFTESAEKPIKKDIALRYGVKDKTLYIQFCPKNQDWRPSDLQNIIPHKDLQIRLPVGLAASLQNFSCESDAADLNVSGLTARGFVFNSASGNLQAANMDCAKVNLDTSSGSVTLVSPNNSAFTLGFDTASGKIQSDLPLVLKTDKYISGSGESLFSINTASGDLIFWTEK